MNKQVVYSCISEIEQGLKELVSNNRFSDLIVCEIINDAIIMMHELDNSSKSDEETAKGLVTMSIDSFYTPKYLQAVEDKYWNWDKRLHYGFRGRIMETPDNLMRFRMAVDITRKQVLEEKNAMLHAVRNHTFKNNESSSYTSKSFIGRFIKTDKRFIQLLTASCITTVLVAFIWKFPDAMRESSQMPTKLGKYIYIDRLDKVHVSRRCPKLNYKGMKSERILVENFKRFNEHSNFCPYCVSDKDYEALTK